jgi:hypothetical protein
MIQSQTYDIFLVHAWRYHPDWKRMVDLLNAHGVRSWRNFSLPWYDPALDPRTEKGGRMVRWHLESQIMPAHAVLLLAGIWREPGTHKWLTFELETARQHAKPILAVPPWGETDIAPDLRERADQVVAWEPAAIFKAIECSRQGVPSEVGVAGSWE